MLAVREMLAEPLNVGASELEVNEIDRVEVVTGEDASAASAALTGDKLKQHRRAPDKFE